MKTKTLLHSFATACSILVFAGFSCDINTNLPEAEPTEVCESNSDCDDGDSCIDGECATTPPPVGCFDDSECGDNQYCAIYETTEPAEAPCWEAEDGTTNCDDGARILPEGVCQDYDVPPPPLEGCLDDSDCSADEFCNFPYEVYSQPDCGPDQDCDSTDDVRIDEGYCEPRYNPTECYDDADCPQGSACIRMGVACADSEDCRDMWYEGGYCSEVTPPNGECGSDLDCGPDAYCEIYEFCVEMPYPCDPEGDCYTEPGCESYGQCIPLTPEWCVSDEDCGPGYRCLMGAPTPAGLIAGQCIPDDVTDCEEQCLWEIDDFLNECLNGSFADEEECFIEAERIMNECVQRNCDVPPPPYECTGDSDCAPGDICVYPGYAPYPGDPADPTHPDQAPPAPYGICVPGEVGCEDQCIFNSDEMLQRCEYTDVDWASCTNEAERALDNCLSTCGLPPPPPVCEDECFARYDDMLGQCLEQGTDPNVCDQIATPILNACFEECGNTNPGECESNADCGEGGTCQTTIEGCEATPSPCLGGPTGEDCDETRPCFDENVDGICDDGDINCGTESICVYEEEPEPLPPSECSVDSECESGSCVMRTTCFFYCDADDAECCFDIGQCEDARPDAP
ncbi:MAG: hypothetical protein GY822_20790 [Deltaproteobacteria bacterium]|nr:hypothetical protein [Deltaproteobacteria bacterium]